MEADKSASQDLSVRFVNPQTLLILRNESGLSLLSEIPTAPLLLNPPMPECTYEVLTGGPEGTPVRFSRVGDKVYHKWSCKHGMQGYCNSIIYLPHTKLYDSQLVEMYCMIIHSCFVDDGANSAFELIDDKG